MWCSAARACVIGATMCASIACGGSDTRTFELERVQPEAAPNCGAPDDGLTLLVTALGDFPPSEQTGRSVDLSQRNEFSLDSFPFGTRVLEVETLGAGGVTASAGRTEVVELSELDDGDSVSVFMAGPRGFCPTGPAAETPRARPIVSRAGRGALVVGGFDAGGAPVTRAEWYDPRQGTLVRVADEVYGDATLGMTGATATDVGDGRVLVAGGPVPAYVVFDANATELGVVAFLPTQRAHHAAVSLGDGRVLLAGGCGSLDTTGACAAGALLTSSSIVDLDSGGVIDGPDLGIARAGGTAILESDGRVLLVGGVDDAGTSVSTAERIDPSGTTPAEQITGAAGGAARLASGSTLVGFAPAGGTADAAAAVIVAGVDAAVPVSNAPRPRAGATLTALDDGRVLVVGGLESEEGAEALLYAPESARFDAVVDSPGVYRREHGAVRLDDGSVLLVGGRSLAGDVLGDAVVFRPDLTGPFTAGITLTFGPIPNELVVVPRDPSRVERRPAQNGDPAALSVASSGGGGTLPSEWFVVGGPTFVDHTATIRARTTGGGLAVIFGFMDADDYRVVVLVPGQASLLYQIVAGEPTVIGECTGQVIESEQLAPGGGFVEALLDLRDGSLTVELGAEQVLACEQVTDVDRGLLGVGVVGTASARVDIASLTVSR